jgi:hypothetical protein
LNLTRDPLQRYRRTRGGDGSKAVSDCGIRIVELRSVEEVEEFAAQLQVGSFNQLDIPEDRKIDILGARTLKNIEAGVPPLLRARVGKRRSVKPLADGAFVGR